MLKEEFLRIMNTHLSEIKTAAWAPHITQVMLNYYARTNSHSLLIWLGEDNQEKRAVAQDIGHSFTDAQVILGRGVIQLTANDYSRTYDLDFYNTYNCRSGSYNWGSGSYNSRSGIYSYRSRN